MDRKQQTKKAAQIEDNHKVTISSPLHQSNRYRVKGISDLLLLRTRISRFPTWLAGYQTFVFHLFDQTRRFVIANGKLSLDITRRTFAILYYDRNRLIIKGIFAIVFLEAQHKVNARAFILGPSTTPLLYSGGP